MKRKCNKVETNVFGDGSENVNMKPTEPMSHMYHIHIQLTHHMPVTNMAYFTV